MKRYKTSNPSGKKAKARTVNVFEAFAKFCNAKTLDDLTTEQLLGYRFLQRCNLIESQSVRLNRAGVVSAGAEAFENATGLIVRGISQDGDRVADVRDPG